LAKVIVEAENTPSLWRVPHTTDLHLRIQANVQFNTFNGQVILPGPQFYLKVPCSLTGGTILLIESFEIDSTYDSPDVPDATYDAWLYAGNTKIGIFLAGFGIKSTDGNQQWIDLVLLRDSGSRPVPISGGMYPVDVIDYKIALALGALRPGSSTQIGNVALDEDPVDPTFPIALSANSTKIAQDVGSDVLVAALATTVASAQVLSTSIIIPTSLDANITGNLHVDRGSIIDGVSFDVYSDNGVDAGAFGWIVFKTP
jgi:hypothetical protein